MSETNAATGPAIDAEDVWVRFLVRHTRPDVTLRATLVNSLDRFRSRNGKGAKEFYALRGVSLQATAGDVIGVIGKNGSGKTTLLKTLGGICTPDRGCVRIAGSVGCLLSFGVGFNNQLTGRENIYLNGTFLGIPKRTIAERCDEIVAFAELEDFIDAPVKTYSAGMRSRLGFSIAAHLDPDILLLDEALSTGDAAFRKKAGTILDRYCHSDKLVVIASHNMELIRRSCTRAIWIEKGEIRMEGEPDEVIDAYLEAPSRRT